MDRASAVLCEGLDSTQPRTYAALARSGNVPYSTLYKRAHGQTSRQEKAEKQQYLTRSEEKTLVTHLLRTSTNNRPIPVKFLCSLALIIKRQRSSIFQAPPADEDLKAPGKNWPRSFYKRHPEINAKRVKALDWNRHDYNIYHKATDWFEVIRRELHDPVILPENVYNMDETGVMLSMLTSLKVLVGQDDPRNYRGAGVKRTMVTAIECISADGRSLHPLIVWPAATHRSTWTTYPIPGWHFACSESGYTDSKISLDWVKLLFDPQTKQRANQKPRILICDGFGMHESLEVLEYCFENNIILCHIPSHTSHKLQPCDVGVFAPLKAAYREQVERLFRGGANTVGKEHFISLYSRARLYPFNLDRVFRGTHKPSDEPAVPEREVKVESCLKDGVPKTPVTSEALSLLLGQIKCDDQFSDEPSKQRLQKLANATEKAFAECALLLDENRLLFEQNNESNCRRSIRSTVVGKAKVMSYEDIEEARAKRDAKEATVIKGKRGPKRKSSASTLAKAKRTQKSEMEVAEDEIKAMGLGDHCSVLQF